MVNTKTTVSKKVLAIVLAVACMVAFTPAMAFTSSAHAAAWKVSPTKATVYVGKYKTLKSTKTAKWTSSKKSVAKLTASKGKTVKVKGVKAGKATIKVTYKGKTKKIAITVKKAIAITAVTVSGKAQVGEVLTATTTPAAATAKYQWYADGTAISGATAKTFTLTADQMGKKITVKVTGTGAYAKSVTSAATDTVAQGLVKAAFDKDYTSSTASVAVGDTLKVNVTPAAAAASVTYQWYRGTTAILGQTSASYTTTANDLGSTLKVVITPTTGKGYDTTAITVGPTVAVKNNVSTLGVTLAANDTTAVPTAGTAYKIKATRTDATAAITGTWSAVAYRDSYVGDTTKDVKATGQTFADTINLNMAATTKNATFSYKLDAADAGHKIVVVLTNANYAGNVQFTIDAVKKTVGTVTIASDSEVTTTSGGTPTTTKNLYPGKTTLTASVGTGVTGTYQWYVGTDATGYTAISGATSASYTIPSTYSGQSGDRTFKVIVTGTGNYSGTGSEKYTGTINNATTIAVQGVTIQKDGAATTSAVAGDKLTAVTSPASASSSFDYVWYVGSAATANKLGEGQTYTVSSSLAAGSKIIVVATNNTDGSTYSGSTFTSAEVTFGTAISSLALAYTNGYTAGTTGYVSYTAPVAGATVSITPTPAAATADYAVYMDSYDANDATRTLISNITVTNGKFIVTDTFTVNGTSGISILGHKLVVVAKGTGNYVGTVQAETPAVTAVVQTIKSIDVYSGTTKLAATGTTTATVGQTLEARAMNSDTTPAAITSGVKYVWTVGGSEVASDTTTSTDTATKAAYATGKYYTVKKADAGKAIAVTATSSDSALATGTATWNNFGVGVIGNTTPATMTGVTSVTGTVKATASTGSPYTYVLTDCTGLSNAKLFNDAGTQVDFPSAGITGTLIKSDSSVSGQVQVGATHTSFVTKQALSAGTYTVTVLDKTFTMTVIDDTSASNTGGFTFSAVAK